MISNVAGHLLCSKTAVPVWHRWSPSLLFPTICLLCLRYLHCCPQWTDFSFRCKWTAESWLEELALRCCAIHSWRVCFVLSMDKFLPQCVAGFVNWDMMFLICFSDIRNGDVPVFPRPPLCLLWNWEAFDEGPFWVATGFKCSLTCLCSFLFPSVFVGTVSAWWFGVLVTLTLCFSGWLVYQHSLVLGQNGATFTVNSDTCFFSIYDKSKPLLCPPLCSTVASECFLLIECLLEL